MSLKEQIMSEDKYTINFPCQIKAIVFISLQIFFSRAGKKCLGTAYRLLLMVQFFEQTNVFSSTKTVKPSLV